MCVKEKKCLKGEWGLHIGELEQQNLELEI